MIDRLKKLPLPAKIILGAVLLLVAFIFWLGFKPTGQQASISEDQILIKKGDDVVLVNRDGLVEYRTKDGGVFYKTWDSDTVSDFFASMEEKARRYLENPTGPCEGCYEVTLYLDGELVVIYAGADDEELNEVYEEFEEEGDDISLSEYFEDEDTNGTSEDGGDGDGSDSDGSDSSDPTPTQTPDDDGFSPEDNYPPVQAGCEDWSGDIVGGKAVISNTLCTIEEE
jgi:hypothetical protein